jgi:hypothetical protein
MLKESVDREETRNILEIVREEEQRNDDIRAKAGTDLILGDILDVKDTSTEQSFNREQVQEQEQVFRRFLPIVYLIDIVMIGTRARTRTRKRKRKRRRESR